MDIQSYIKTHLSNVYKNSIHNIYVLIKWLILSSIIGVIVSAIVTFFKYIINFSSTLRENNSFLLFFLPLAGLIIVGSYEILGLKTDPGINIIISSIRRNKLDNVVHSDKKVPIKLTPLVILASALTHLCGGSVGRTGAALQIGGSTASEIASILKLNNKDKKILIMCGISAGFAAILGTPLSATIF